MRLPISKSDSEMSDSEGSRSVDAKSDNPENMRFSERIKSRHQRWWIDKQKHPFKQLGGKITGRTFAADLGVKVPDLYALVDRVDDIQDVSGLPEKYVIKPTRGWSANNVFLMDDGVNTLDGRQWTRAAIVEQIKSDAIASQPGVKYIVEEYLSNWDGKAGIPYDYKFYMFGSEIAFIHVIERNSGVHIAQNRHWFMTRSWEPITKRIVETQKPEGTPAPMPSSMDELLAVTLKMGSKLNMFMRIDMYATTRGAVFGEFTPQPHGGNGYTEWADAWLGELWRGEEGVLS